MKYLFFLFSIIITFLFINTTPPTIYLGDSGEIVTAVWTLGIGHPPGYPLYTLTGKIFSLIPLGDIAYRINLFSVFLSLLVFAFLFLNIIFFISLISKSENKNLVYFVALIISLFYVFSETFWFESINAKGGVYVFAQLIVLLSFFSFFKFISTKKIKYCYLSLYLCGFLIPSHNSTALLAILIIILNLYFAQKSGDKFLIIKLLSFFVFSFLTSYLFLFIRVKGNPVFVWSGINGCREVLEHILRKRYSSDVQISLPVIKFRLYNYFILFIKNYNIIIILFFTGLYYTYTKNKNVFFILSVFFVINTVLLILGIETSTGFNLSSLTTISLYISRGFYLINDLLPITISACGLFFLFDLLNDKYKINTTFMCVIFLFFPFIMIFNNYELNNQSKKFLGYDHPINIMNSLNKGNILFSRNDCPSFNILYVKYVKNKYRDYVVYDRDAATLDISIYGKTKDKKKMQTIESKFVLENVNNVFFTDYYDDKNSNIKSTSYGILFKTYTDKEPYYNNVNLLQLYTIRDYFNNKKLDLFYNDFIAKYFIAKAENFAKCNDRQNTLKWIDFVEKIGGKSPATIKEIIRIVFGELKDIDLSIKYLKKLVYLNPYDINTLNILLKIYFQYNFNEALEWMDEFYNFLPDSKYKKSIKKQLELYKQLKKDNMQ
ncbi:MAG: DUF2723 domain-containing protein [Candidatus Goldbacteria bacterium]|nr:DUF2723 domain-containing protein [Candidatus Goldiibacteriota bacterium]